jgi:tRNA A37 threonylcarbamoyladenosine synthetase subunit TsaC/SUA5/YrdC
MNQDLIDAYKKLDAIKEFECDHNITIILEMLNKWNKKANNNKELKTVIESFLDIQWHIIELKRDRDLALKAVMQYKIQRDAALDEKSKAIKQLKLYEDQNFD